MESNFETKLPDDLQHKLAFDGRPYVIRVEHKDVDHPARSKGLVAGGRSLADRDECIIVCFTSRLHDFDDDHHHQLPIEILEMALYHMPSMLSHDESAALHAAIDAWVAEHRRVAALLSHQNE